jgi:hypothetical protein
VDGREYDRTDDRMSLFSCLPTLKESRVINDRHITSHDGPLNLLQNVAQVCVDASTMPPQLRDSICRKVSDGVSDLLGGQWCILIRRDPHIEHVQEQRNETRLALRADVLPTFHNAA